MSVSSDDLVYWQSWVGKPETSSEIIAPVLLDRFAAAIGENRNHGTMPSLGHWAFFIDTVQPDRLGTDGHPQRGGFLPPISLERRMFAASDIRFRAPLAEGLEATQHSELVSLKHKQGTSGDLILAELFNRIEQADATCIEERQTIVYRASGMATPAVEVQELNFPDGAESWSPTTPDLFRFSAATFNSHRIHYDLPYATGEELYPGLVIHGPFTAAKLFGLARRLAGPISRFSFRAQAPLFCGQPVLLCRAKEANTVIAIRCDGVIAMSARFET